MSLSTLRKSYKSLISSLLSRLPAYEAARQAIGGQFIPFGIIEREALIQYGLKPDGYVIDVGCGSGRLANALADFLTTKGKYLGIDIMSELLSHARGLVSRPNFKFEVAPGFKIPEAESQADIVCFFSVFTHISFEESYTYLTEAKRVLGNDGRIIFSFLEFRIPCHWDVFSANLQRLTEETPPDVFLSREAIQVWATHLGLKVISIDDCLEDTIPLPHPVRLDDGRVMEHRGSLGQTICVLEKSNSLEP